MTIRTIQRDDATIALIESSERLITDVQSALDLMATVRYETNCDRMILPKTAVAEDFFKNFITEKSATMYELVENFRSKRNIVDFSNRFASKISHRLKMVPIQSVQNDNGKIKIFQHKSSNLVVPLVNSIISEMLSGTTCVLTDTNDDALQITGLLVKHGFQAKLIQSNEGFNLYNLQEIRCFLNQLNLAEDVYIISKEIWDQAKQRLIREFNHSTNLEVCINILKEFENTNKKIKYKSDLEVFIRESKYDDFYSEKNEAIFVSTIHKAKGREFENVFLILNRFVPKSDEDIRKIYVALTRAKNNLVIHYNGNYFDSINTDNLERIIDDENYPAPQQIAMQLTYRDVFLDFFQSTQDLVSKLTSGDELLIDDNYRCSYNGRVVLKFSKQFIEKLEAMRQKNYIPRIAKIRFIVYWKRENSQQEIKIILPDVYFERLDQD